MTDKPISIITGKPSLRGARVGDGLTWRQRNAEAVRLRKRQLYAENNAKHRARASQYRKKNREKVAAANRVWLMAYRAKLRSEMITAYGGKCACCDEKEPKFLQLDHIFNDGAKDRVVNKTSTKLWARLKKKGWPEDRYQLLCANCNFGKLMNGGTCPHQSQF